ncbi:MAG: hypothetical protein HND55_06050 [Pseudomonadota bacterium]|nr:MAG: hypothetical protein HND55_06050 [Pseudomonadota bacterium]
MSGALLIAVAAFATIGCDNNRTHDPGLVQAPRFVDEKGERDRAWLMSHHANRGSYALTIDDGTAIIERTGPEPWGLLSQFFPREVVEELAGRTLAFSADLKLDLEDDTWGTPIEPVGFRVKVFKARDPRGNPLHAMLGVRPQENFVLNVPNDVTQRDWQRYTLEFRLPDDAWEIEAAVFMSRGGRLYVRNPSLTVVD